MCGDRDGGCDSPAEVGDSRTDEPTIERKPKNELSPTGNRRVFELELEAVWIDDLDLGIDVSAGVTQDNGVLNDFRLLEVVEVDGEILTTDVVTDFPIDLAKGLASILIAPLSVRTLFRLDKHP